MTFTKKTYLLDGKPRTYGDKIIEVDNDFVLNDVVTQPVFSPTPLADDAITHDRIIPRIFQLDGEKAKQTGLNIRILYWAGLIDYNGAPWDHEESGNLVQRTQYPYAGHLDDPYEPEIDLSFGMPIEVYWKISKLEYTDNNLYNQYHKRAVEEIIDANSRLVIGDFDLTPTDIFQLSFRKLYRFEGENHRLNKVIDYDLSTRKKTRCEFIKAKDIGEFVPTQKVVTGGIDDTIGSGGTILPRPPLPPIREHGNIYNPAEHVVAGIDNNVPRTSVGITIVGEDNVIGGECANILIIGSNNLVTAGNSNVTLIHCDGLEITESDVLYINNCLVDECPDPSTALDARSGQAELIDSTVNVVNGAVTTGAVIIITPVDTFTGLLTVTANAGSFDIDSDIVAESGTVNYFIASY